MCFHLKHLVVTRNLLHINFVDLVSFFVLITRCFLIIDFGEFERNVWFPWGVFSQFIQVIWTKKTSRMLNISF
jgi:hypothetical protein